MLPCYTVTTAIFQTSPLPCKIRRDESNTKDHSIAPFYHDFVDTACVLGHIAVPVAVPVMAVPLAYRLYMLLLHRTSLRTDKLCRLRSWCSDMGIDMSLQVPRSDEPFRMKCTTPVMPVLLVKSCGIL